MFFCVLYCRRERLNTLSQQNRARQKVQSSSTGGGGDTSPRQSEARQPSGNEATSEHEACEHTLANQLAGSEEEKTVIPSGHRSPRDSGGNPPLAVANPLHQNPEDNGADPSQTVLDPLRHPPRDSVGDPPLSVTDSVHEPPGDSRGDTETILDPLRYPPQILEPLHQPADTAATPSHYQMSNNTFDNFVIAMHRKVVSRLTYTWSIVKCSAGTCSIVLSSQGPCCPCAPSGIVGLGCDSA